MDRLLNAREVIEVLGVSLRKLDLMIKQEEGPPFILIGRQRRWRQHDVAQWLETLAVRSTASLRTRRSPSEQEG